MNFIKKHRKEFIAIAIGSFAGWAYYYFVGCSSGGCMISGNPYISIPYGGFLGYLFFGSFLKSKEVINEVD
jgi:hypothetical protein